jgi:hypothetical protein
MSWLCGRRSLGAGMAAVLTTGYFYGILRARYLDGFSHFIFDAAVLGLYLARLTLPNALAPPYARRLAGWTWVLVGWPLVLFGLCFLYPQHPLIQLVGLRAAVWFLPFLLLGVSARPEDLTHLARALAVLNLVAFAFAVGEYFRGLEPFFPHNAVTDIMYRSKDVAGLTHYRIPATFGAAASYGGIMAASIPWLAGRWVMPGIPVRERALLVAGVLAAALGSFMCGSRMPVVFVLVLGSVLVYQLGIKLRYLIPALGVAAVVAYFVAGNERLQRFTSLQDTEAVVGRLEGSANVDAARLLVQYPLGTGLGSAHGTSVPSFLQHLMLPYVGAENEYVRIGLEQSLLGLGIWLGFLVWFFGGHRIPPSRGWALGAKLMLTHALLCWGVGLIGTGLLASIPGTALLLFEMGVLARDYPVPVPRPRLRRAAEGSRAARAALPVNGRA